MLMRPSKAETAYKSLFLDFSRLKSDTPISYGDPPFHTLSVGEQLCCSQRNPAYHLMPLKVVPPALRCEVEEAVVWVVVEVEAGEDAG